MIEDFVAEVVRGQDYDSLYGEANVESEQQISAGSNIRGEVAQEQLRAQSFARDSLDKLRFACYD